jgi:hypothetical protein
MNRAIWGRALARCYEGLACGESDDGCTLQAVIEIGLSPDAAIHAPDVHQCLDKHTQCKAGPAEFPDDDCGTLIFLLDGTREALARCYGLGCEGVAACVKSAFGT